MSVQLTFFGGTMATADFGVIDICCGLESLFSPLMDLRKSYV